MHAIAALIAAEHLRDLYREAEEARLHRLLDSVRPARPARTFGFVRRIVSAVRRLLGQPAEGRRTRPAGA